MMAGGGLLVPCCAVQVFGRGGAPGGGGKSGDPPVYRYIYISHTLQSYSTKPVSYIYNTSELHYKTSIAML